MGVVKQGIKMPSVSVIVPVFNSDKYLSETMNSLLKQDFDDYEVICLYCQSKDNSLNILNRFANVDQRIKVVVRSQEYAGQSRNYGIDVANGDYIVFVDSDDILPETALSTMYETATKTKADMVCFNAREFRNNTLGDLMINYSQIPQDVKLSKTEDFFVVPNFSWGRIYRSSFLKEHSIQFSTSKFAEDVIFCIRAYVEADSVVVSDRVVYLYRKTDNSATSKIDTCYLDLINEYKIALDFVRKYGNEATFRSFSRCLGHTYIYFYRHLLTSSASKADFFLKMKKIFRELNPAYFSDFYKKEFNAVKRANNYKAFDQLIKWDFAFKFSLIGIPVLSAKKSGNVTKFYLFSIIPIARLKK